VQLLCGGYMGRSIFVRSIAIAILGRRAVSCFGGCWLLLLLGEGNVGGERKEWVSGVRQEGRLFGVAAVDFAGSGR
jgi:hypothetical protein